MIFMTKPICVLTADKFNVYYQSFISESKNLGVVIDKNLRLLASLDVLSDDLEQSF